MAAAAAAARILAAAARLLLASIFTGWILVWVFRPTVAFKTHFLTPVISATATKAYGTTGSYVLVFTAPVLLLAFLAAIYLNLRSATTSSRRTRPLRSNLWTYPVFIEGPLALASAAELAVLAAFVVLYAWTTYKHLAVYFSRIDVTHAGNMDLDTRPEWEKKFEAVGDRLGAAGAVPFLFLFFPVARLSSLMRLVNIPFEHAVRYHIWTAHIMMVLWSAHSLVYVVYWPIAHKSSKFFISKDDTEISGRTGLVTWIVGLVIWATSLGPVRKHKFEFFYYTHQLYLVFILGFVLHVGEKWLAMMVPGVFLFFVDRLLRFLQSRRHVDVVSARLISSETVELKFAKLPSLEYPAASAIFLKLPALSTLQWHPFTLTSCSSVDVDHISVLVKCNGKWTEKLRDLLMKQTPLQLEAAIEGPYGHSLDYLEKYKVMVFVAGGSGISPFISIIKDLLYKIETKQMPLPEKVSLIWSLRKAEELSVLESLSPLDLCPNFAKELNFEVQAYVTRDDGIDLETTTDQKAVLPPSRAGSPRMFGPSTMKMLAGPSDYKLYAAVVLASFAGYLLLAGIIHRFYIYPIDHDTYEVYSRSGRGVISLLEYLAGVCVFGGATALICSWWKWNKEDPKEFEMVPQQGVAQRKGSFKPGKVHHGYRPEFEGIFAEYSGKKGNQHIGVFACGPEGMQESVGLQCKALMLSFHPLNYNL